jgi:hypothetical protein
MSTIVAATLQSLDALTSATVKTGNNSAGSLIVNPTGGLVLASNSTTNVVVVAANGNLGIDTASPIETIDAYLNANSANYFRVQNANTSANAFAGVYAQTATVSTYLRSNTTTGIIGPTTAHPLYLIANNNTGGVLAANLNMGFGNTAPAQKLVVEGNMYANGVPLQMTYLRYDTKSTYSYTTAGTTGTVITDLNASITPRRTTSKILVTYCIAYEVHQDTIFQLYRNDGGANTKIGNNATDSNYWSGIWMPSYDVDTSSTPRQATLMYLDSPSTTNTCTYQLMIQSAGVGAGTFYLNRAAGSAGAATYEVAISQVFLQEIGQI